jgi:hypothetical protein
MTSLDDAEPWRYLSTLGERRRGTYAYVDRIRGG